MKHQLLGALAFAAALALLLELGAWIYTLATTPRFQPVNGWEGVPGFKANGEKDPKHPRWQAEN